MIRVLKRQAGLSLVEVLASIAVLAGITVGVSQLTQNMSNETRANIAALHTKTVGDAAGLYIKDNYAAVVAVATTTTPALIRISDLIATGYLPAGYSVANNNGQNTCVLVLEPTTNNLAGLVVTEGGTALDDLTTGSIAATIGGAGGGIYSTATTTLRGTMNGWSMPVGAYANANHLNQNCAGTGGAVSFTAGHPVMAIWLSDTAQASGALYRDAVPSNPSLNTMTTPLIMASVQTLSSACTTTGSIARDSGGAVLSCQGGTWKSQGGAGYWKDPVADYISLPGSGNQTGDVRLTNDTRRAFAWNGSSWGALAVDQSGNLSVPGSLTAGESYTNGWFRVNSGGGIYWQAYGGGWYMSDGTWLRSYNGKDVYTSGVMRADNGFQVDGNQVITGDSYLNAVNTVSQGAGCSPNGLIAKDSTGLLLSCQSGVWKKAGGFNAATVLSRTVMNTSYYGCNWNAPYTGTGSASCNGDEAITGCNGSVSGKTCYAYGTVGYGAGCDGNPATAVTAYATCVK